MSDTFGIVHPEDSPTGGFIITLWSEYCAYRAGGKIMNYIPANDLVDAKAKAEKLNAVCF